jgi:cytochrome c-type biogenesis protein CcmE
MSKLDDELRKAISDGESGEEASPAPQPVTSEASEEGHGRRNLGVLLGLLAIGGGILSFVLGQDGDQLTYAKDVKTVVGNQAELGSRNLKVQGVLVAGSLTKREEPCEYRFKIRQKEDPAGAVMSVRFPQCIVPDTFRDVPGIDVEATVTGQLQGDHFQANLIEAKCPSKYEMQQRQLAGEQKPHGETNAADPWKIAPSGEGS